MFYETLVASKWKLIVFERPKSSNWQDDNCTALQLDTNVGLDQLEDASYELDKFIHSARAQLFEIRKKKARKTGLRPLRDAFSGHEEREVHAPRS